MLLTNSCGRGKATRDSCLDLAILARPEWLPANLASPEREWEEFASGNDAIQAFGRTGRYSHVHLGLGDGVFTATEQDEAGPPDSLEVGIGNLLVYSSPLWERMATARAWRRSGAHGFPTTTRTFAASGWLPCAGFA